MRRLVMLIAVVVGLYGAAVGYLYLFQRSFVFQPGGALATPAEKGLGGVEVVTLTMADGTELTGWYAPPQDGLPTLLYFHGNALNLSDRADRFQQVLDSGYGLLAMSYRGYPGSDGSPSETAFFSDALETFDWLAARGDAIVLFGESLGTGVATYVAAERPAQALVLEAPYTAAVDIAGEAYPWAPVGLLMRDPFRSSDRIGQVEEPLLVVHGTDDRVVPFAQSEALFAAANEPKEFAVFEGASHHDLWDRGLWPTTLAFLEGHDAGL